LGGVSEWSKEAVLKTAVDSAQGVFSQSTYEHGPGRLGVLLGASGPGITPQDPDLAAVVAAWPGLPEALRAGIVAMVNAAGGSAKP